MIAGIEATQHSEFEQHADRGRCDQCQRDCDYEGAGCLRQGGRHVGPQHVERSVGEVDRIHDAEHERKACGQQEEHEPELQSVQRLLEEEET